MQQLEVPETTVTKIIKATVDVDKAYDSFWKLIHFTQSFADVSLPDNNFRVVGTDAAQLARALKGQDRQTVLQATKLALGGSLTEEDIRLISNRKAQLDIFERLLTDEEFFERQRKQRGPNTKREAVWQAFFEANPWIFGYGLNLVACEPLDEEKLERFTTGANIFTGAGKRIDAILRTKGYISSFAFCEIKTHATPLLEKTAYRQPDVYQVSKEVSGGLSQVQKTVSKALAAITQQIYTHFEDDGAPTGIQVSTIRPRQVLVVGNLDEFKVNGMVNPEKMTSFELYRSAIHDVEIITFDELYERACFIVRDE